MMRKFGDLKFGVFVIEIAGMKLNSAKKLAENTQKQLNSNHPISI